jgi:hypothetical protein
VTGTLDVEGADGTGTVRGYGDLVVVSLPTLAAARSLAGGVAMATHGPGERLTDALSRSDLTVDVRVRGVSVARVGESAGGPLARALSERLGVDAAPSVGGLVRSLFR